MGSLKVEELDSENADKSVNSKEICKLSSDGALSIPIAIT